MSLGYLIRADTVERRHLHRRAKDRKPVDIKAFEDKVEQDMLRRKAQSYLVDSELSPWSQTTMLTSVGTGKRRTQGYSQDLILDHEHVDSMTSVSSKPPENPPENKQDHSQWTNPMEQLSVSGEVMVGTVNRRSSSLPSRNSSKCLGSPVTQKSKRSFTKSLRDVVAYIIEVLDVSDKEEDMAKTVIRVDQEENFREETTPPEEEGIAEAGVEYQGSPEAGDFMKMPLFVHAAAYKPPLLTPSLAKPAAPKPPLQPQQAKPVLKCSGKKTSEPKMSSSLIKGIFKDYAKMPVAKESFRIVEKCTQKYFKQLWNDLAAFSSHAGRKTVEVSDIEVLMRRQKLVTDKIPLHVLIERHLPLDYRKLLIPVAVSGNKVVPEIRHRSSHRLWKNA